MPITPHQHHLSVSASKNGPPPPIDNAACVALVTGALKGAREKTRELLSRNGTSPGENGTQKAGITLDLSHQKIASIPIEVIELIKDEIERLALAHNQLSSFPTEFSSLPRLRYLNLRSNFLREFPLALTRLPSLEILDVSRNRLREFPPDLGNLMSLKVLSMAKNKLSALPTYIGSMNDLKILKLDHNPITFPPREVWDTEEAGQDAWLENMKRFLRQHTERSNSTQESESGSSDDDDSFNPSFTRTPSFEASANESGALTLPTIRPLRNNSVAAPGEASRARSPAPSNITGHKRSKHLSNSSINISPSQPMNGSPKRSETPAFGFSIDSPQAERHRSNSESTLGTNRDKRRGMPPPPRMGSVPRTKPIFNPQSLKPVDEKPFKHTRGYSHDSVIDGGGQSNSLIPSRSPTDNERRPGQYFRRLSSLPEHKRSSLSSGRVGEAARGILYSMSTLQHPIEQYIQSLGEAGGAESKVGRALYNSKMHLSSLVSALEAYDAKDDEPAVQKVIDACQSCVAAFRQVLAMLQSSLKELGAGSCPDVRCTRTLILMIYGAYVEIQCSYDILRPLLLAHSITDGSRAGSLTSRHHQGLNMSHARQNTGSNNSLTDSGASGMSIPPPLATPRSMESFAIPPTPGAHPAMNSQNPDIGFDQEDALYQKFLAAINAALSTLPQVDRDIKSSGTQNLQPAVALKLREVSSLCMSGCDAARRLSKIRWDAVQEGDQIERKKFWDDTNKFTQLVISIAELIKSVTQEYTFPIRTLAAMGTVLRPTKDLFILMNDSALRFSAEPQQSVGQASPYAHTFSFQSMTMMPATPLSAALGPAAQATMPQLMYQRTASQLGGLSVNSSRTGTFLSSYAPTMTSQTTEVGMNFPGNGGLNSPVPRMVMKPTTATATPEVDEKSRLRD
ncbi:RAM signaling pathway protein-domain-containing protein [Sphaerosporella brunnea]|uniref:RAM signaling pathway protein-domain-containing protein n=1 Tax=Sphaerosporella brunnea TaxID=1250544 RepID=A0A5J5EQM0_9PEZI|nr:RAM signaling pathway protein-domain-containing protein [Sphaerosporella brunnea]